MIYRSSSFCSCLTVYSLTEYSLTTVSVWPGIDGPKSTGLGPKKLRNLGPDLDREILRNLGPTEEQVHFRKPGPTRTRSLDP